MASSADMNIDAKPYQFCGEWTTNVLVSRLSKALHREAIPHVLWGEYALTLYGVPGMPREISIVVPDKDFVRAQNLFDNSYLPHCVEWQNHRCPCCSPKKSDDPQPSARMHYRLHVNDWLHLYRQSEVLWLMDLSDALLAPEDHCEYTNNENFLLSSSAELPPPQAGAISKQCSGPFAPGLHPIHLPSATRLVESLLLLFARDQTQKMSYYWSHKLFLLANHCPARLIDLTQLPPVCKHAYDLMMEGDIDRSYMIVRQIAIYKELMPPAGTDRFGNELPGPPLAF